MRIFPVAMLSLLISTSCSDKYLYPQDGGIYYGEFLNSEYELFFFHEEVFALISNGERSAYYQFEINPIIFRIQNDFWSGQLVYNGSTFIDEYQDPLQVFEYDKEYGGIIFMFEGENLWIGGRSLKKAEGEMARQMFNRLLAQKNLSQNPFYIRPPHDWPKEYQHR